MKRYEMSYKFFDMEQEAKDFCKQIKDGQNDYAKRKYPPSYTPWSNETKTENKFVVFYYI